MKPALERETMVRLLTIAFQYDTSSVPTACLKEIMT
jgi:hypothetical protein